MEDIQQVEYVQINNSETKKNQQKGMYRNKHCQCHDHKTTKIKTVVNLYFEAITVIKKEEQNNNNTCNTTTTTQKKRP